MSIGINSVLTDLHYQLLGIGVTYEMRNISRYIKRIFYQTFRVFRQFYFEAIRKKITNILGP